MIPNGRRLRHTCPPPARWGGRCHPSVANERNSPLHRLRIVTPLIIVLVLVTACQPVQTQLPPTPTTAPTIAPTLVPTSPPTAAATTAPATAAPATVTAAPTAVESTATPAPTHVQAATAEAGVLA